VTVAAAGLAARELIARVFPGAEPTTEQPLVFAPGSGGELLELGQGGDVNAACALLVREFRLGARTVRGGLIGSVATDPAWRGRGLGTRLLGEAEDKLRARGCTFALLWAEDPRFYLARGYVPFGVESDTLLASELAPRLPEPSGVRLFRAGDEPGLHRLYQRHPARVERSAEEMRALLAVPGMLTLVRERAAGPGRPQPVAYACLGRGRDLTDAVHEWGGEPEDVLALLRAHLERRFPTGQSGALFLMTPPGASELVQRLVALGAPSTQGILGLGKLLDLGLAGELLGAVLGPEARVTSGAGTLELRGPAAGCELDLDALQAVLFGGPEVHDEVRALLARLGCTGAELPLEPFAFGLDSI
jgi:GNAT superfamily N-acetyltransferase